ncbi:MAG: radical SAM protein, partial [Acidobacteriota bacterium]|nr:radical SAM protein [Acidobacteriota bacterium]
MTGTAWTTQRRLTRRGVLWLGLQCDVRCKFCYDELVPADEKGWIPPAEAFARLDAFRRDYANEHVDLMGGEPTLYPHVLDIVRHAAAIGLRPTVITHGMRLADTDLVDKYAAAGVHDFLVSVQGIGETLAAVHRRGRDNFAKQVRALDNLSAAGVPFRFNVTMIRDNVEQLPAIADLAGEKGARVVNFLTYNPYFEWTDAPSIPFQLRHSEVAPHLATAIDRCTALGIEANVRYLPICQLPGREPHVYTGHQLPFDTHEWDYNSWYGEGHPAPPPEKWYRDASRHQAERHQYRKPPPCAGCALRNVCDGFHAQYLERWGSEEARPYPGEPTDDPTVFIGSQRKLEYTAAPQGPGVDAPPAAEDPPTL